MSLVYDDYDDSNQVDMFSWKHAVNKDSITIALNGRIRKEIEDRIISLRHTIVNQSSTIENYKRDIKRLHDSNSHNRRIVETEQKHLSESIKHIATDLDLLTKHEKIRDVLIEGSDIVVHTVPLYMFDLTDNRYYLGNCNFRIDIFTTTITFDNDNRKQGYWNEDDVHPHISGAGEACWGSIDATIAELCSQYQIYAIAMMCINFLEQANTDDSAGQYVISWDKVDESGNIIAIGGTYGLPHHTMCECCENYVHDDDMVTVYGDVDEITEPDDEDDLVINTSYGELHNQHMVCPSCRSNDYRWIEDVNAYVARERWNN